MVKSCQAQGDHTAVPDGKVLFDMEGDSCLAMISRTSLAVQVLRSALRILASGTAVEQHRTGLYPLSWYFRGKVPNRGAVQVG